MGPTPLSFFLAKTYTSTPLYAITEHPALSRASYDAGLRSLAQGKYDNARVQFEEVLKSEPNAGDVYYFIGETYRIEGNPYSARDSYQEAINHDAAFAPAFLGRAQANLVINPDAEVIGDLNEAVRLDPNYAEAYIERGKYQLSRDPVAAESDLNSAIGINPNSAVAFLFLSQAQLENDENAASLEFGDTGQPTRPYPGPGVSGIGPRVHRHGPDRQSGAGPADLYHLCSHGYQRISLTGSGL